MEKYFDINRDGFSVRCKLYYEKGRETSRVVCFAHGFGGHKDTKAAERFAEHFMSKYKGSVVLTFDWPCHGKDALGKLRLEDCERYLTYVVEYIGENFPGADLFGYATSFGGYLYLRYIQKYGNPFKKIALRCPAINMFESLSKRILTPENWVILEKGKDIDAGFDRKVKLDKQFMDELGSDESDIRKKDFLDFADDILIIHGDKDEIIPIMQSRSFAENNVIELIEVEGADHRFIDPKKMDFAISETMKFFIKETN